MDKCFCHLNGYKVKDADARKMLEGKLSMGDIKVSGIKCKNLIDYKNIQSGPNTTASILNDGFKVSGSYAVILTVENLKANTDYYLQYITENIIGTTKMVVLFPKGQQTSSFKSFLNGTGGVFNTGNNTAIDIWFYSGSGASGEVNFTNVQLEIGNKATEYVPYFEIGVGASNGSGECEIFKVFVPVDNKITNFPDGYNVASIEGVKNGLNEFISKCRSDGNYNRILHLGIGTYNDVYQSYLFTNYRKGSVSYGSNGYTERKYLCVGGDYSYWNYDSSGSYTIYTELVIQEKEDGSINAAKLYNTTFRNIPNNNTLPFTPTSDYNPVHKKYVDDLVYKSGFYEIKGDFSELLTTGEINEFTRSFEITNSTILNKLKTFMTYVKTSNLKSPRLSLVNTVTESTDSDGTKITYPTNIEFSNINHIGVGDDGSDMYVFKSYPVVTIAPDGIVQGEPMHVSKINLVEYQLQINVTWSGDTATITNAWCGGMWLNLKTTYGEN